MALDPSALISGMTSAMAAGFVPPPANAPFQTIAAAMANAYHSYASAAQACNGSGPSGQNLTGLIDGLTDALDISGGPKTPAVAGEAWADSCATYWSGAVFGGGAITLALDAAGLKAALEALFNTNPPPPGITLFPAFINGFAGALDSYTKLIEVTDPSVPPPSGCAGPIM